jgi:hypothetical protein
VRHVNEPVRHVGTAFGRGRGKPPAEALRFLLAWSGVVVRAAPSPVLANQLGDSMEPALLLTLILIVAAIAWCFVQVRNLNRRLTSLEKQHLAMVAEIEEKLFSR